MTGRRPPPAPPGGWAPWVQEVLLSPRYCRRSSHTQGASRPPCFVRCGDRQVSQVALLGHSGQRQPRPCPHPGAKLFNTSVFGIRPGNSYLLQFLLEQEFSFFWVQIPERGAPRAAPPFLGDRKVCGFPTGGSRCGPDSPGCIQQREESRGLRQPSLLPRFQLQEKCLLSVFRVRRRNLFFKRELNQTPRSKNRPSNGAPRA